MTITAAKVGDVVDFTAAEYARVGDASPDEEGVMRIARLAAVPFALAAALASRDVRAGGDAPADPGKFVTRIDASAGKAFKYHWTESTKFDAVSGFGAPYAGDFECDLVVTAGERVGESTQFDVAVGPVKANVSGGVGKAALNTANAPASSLGHGPADKVLLAKDVVILASKKFGIALSDRLAQTDTWGLDDAWNAYKLKLGAAQRKWIDALSPPWNGVRTALDLKALFQVSETTPGAAKQTVQISEGCTDKLEALDAEMAQIAMQRLVRPPGGETASLVRLWISRRDGMPVQATHEETTLVLDSAQKWTSKTTVAIAMTRTATIEPKPAPAKPADGK